MDEENKNLENDDQENVNPEDQNQEEINQGASENAPEEEAPPAPAPASEAAEAPVQSDTGVDEEDEPVGTLQGHAMKFGLIVGLIGVIITVLLYIIDPVMLVNLWLGLFFLVIYLGFIIYGGINYRNQIGGYIGFGKAFFHGFLILVIAGLIGTIFQFLLYKVIDPNVVNTLIDASVENARSIAERFGAQGDALDQALEQARTDTAARFTAGGMIKGFLWSFIFFAIAALISGAIVKKKLPESDVV